MYFGVWLHQFHYTGIKERLSWRKKYFFSFPKIKNFVAFKFNYELGTPLPERRNQRKLSKDWEMQLANSEGDISVVVFNICPIEKQSLHQKYQPRVGNLIDSIFHRFNNPSTFFYWQ
jgi:hypothetical protein